MNEGTYNNAIRSNSPFSPMTPSGPTASSYKTNVNRTKTRKWVEAKVQSYDGDDWGNEYEDEYDEEPQQEPPPKTTELRPQHAANTLPSSRALSQSPTATDSSNMPGPLGMRNTGGLPSLHIQTGVNPRSRLAESAPSAQNFGPGLSRFPPRQSSIGRREVHAPRSGSQPAKALGSAANPSQVVRPANIYQRMGEEIAKERGSMELGRPDSAGRGDSVITRGSVARLAFAEGRKSEYGTGPLISSGQSGAESGQERPNRQRVSISPKLPDLARMSGFGDAFFSDTGGFGSIADSSLSSAPDSQLATVTNSKFRPSVGLGDEWHDTLGLSEGKPPSSTLEGPKLEPNPNIIMPPLDQNMEIRKAESSDARRRSVLSRPQLSETWGSEATATGPGRLTPIEKPVGAGSTSLGSITKVDGPPMGGGHAEPADIEPTTTVRQLPSAQSESNVPAEIKSAYKLKSNDFDSPTGKHDRNVASKAVAAGPGYHPTPQSLPPLKTDNPLVKPNIAQTGAPEVQRQNNMEPSSLVYKDSPSQSSPSTQPSVATTGPGFTPTAPLNPHRSLVALRDVVVPATQERKSTMSTIDTASPEKESDKLREEIIKSLSASPATATGASVILGSSHGDSDPSKGGLTRESTYLSGVYDDYLTPVEEKSLQETGQVLKKGAGQAGETSAASSPSSQKDDPFPKIAALSPQRSPEPKITSRPRRFSWEDGPGRVGLSPIEAEPNASVLSFGPSLDGQSKNGPTPATEWNATVPSSGALRTQTEGAGIISHQVSQTAERSPKVQAATTDISRLSFAEEKEKVLIQSYSNTPSEEQHPALAKPPELTLAPSPVIQSIPQAKIMAFRDILNIVSIEQRINKFDETRAQFYSMDSGLSNWIAYMQSQPEHVATIMCAGGQPGGTLAQGQTSPGSQLPTQQPYYQQYLNASNPSAPPGQLGRTSTSNLQQMFTGQPMSGFGSGNQVGAKSKELLHAAGAFGNKGMKSGMKLFNKGKSKLRGTGDKVFF
ncbi:hypothetical protein AAE478_009057 [Parahypoxylon ruwenzoriense]